MIKLQLSKFKFEKVSARDYVECDDCQTTSDILEDEEIIEMVNYPFSHNKKLQTTNKRTKYGGGRNERVGKRRHTSLDESQATTREGSRRVRLQKDSKEGRQSTKRLLRRIERVRTTIVSLIPVVQRRHQSQKGIQWSMKSLLPVNREQAV